MQGKVLSISVKIGKDIPVCTLSPICNSDIVTSFPFFSRTLAVEGKQDGDGEGGDVVGGGGGGGGGGAGVVVFGEPTQQWKVSPHLAKHILGQFKVAYKK